ncbi:grasp-with-spasm system SPASM domain peptide maturase [Chryseobacterium camelliae]|uniref:grasp-with-spasm system SPASM domain peptide maturase n=1 Tax=Chryseobacterium camelliae TaxID=1265445 RepID=UPI002855678B|nr:grasp-with-spasm system SPASM domain peptide maturase [Chryseobacterium camelliae]MDR6514595.1 SPASM domain peptide maturase of grasp-with-spasm system [Chryseobacterium camelliae]
MNYFNLFSNILITKGAKRILVTDLQRNQSELYPIEFFDIINALKENSIENVIASYDSESHELIKEYIELLLEKEFGFITKKSWDKNFPSFLYQFITPNAITNAYLEIKNINILNQINESLSNLGTEYVVIHYYNILDIDEIKYIEEIFKNSTITAIEIISEYNQIHNELFIETAESFCKRIYHFSFYNCQRSPFKLKNKYKFTLSFVKEKINTNSCGKVDLKYFNTNLQKVVEAINYNSCLHKKISIDINGNIKNCPAMTQSFGNIANTTLEKALTDHEFRKYWNLTKDNIEICKDCEFRYICTDCRAYTEQTSFSSEGLDISKPLKCGYDPYSGRWESWSKNPLKRKAMKLSVLKK